MNHEALASYPVILRIPVQWGEMDAYGHVNNTVFFRYFESARIVYLDRCGFLDSYDHDRVGAILHSTQCRFREALFYPDTAIVGARGTDVGEDRFTMIYRIVSESRGSVAADGEGVVVSFDYRARRKTPLPDAVRAGIERLESGK